MKKQRHWLDLAEYASLVGLGVGSVASFVSSQVLYTSAPLSLLVLLNLANRRRLEQSLQQNASVVVAELDRKFSKNIELLNQQVMALPTSETLARVKQSMLIKNRETLEQLSAEISALQKNMVERFAVLDQQNLGSMRQEIGAIQGQYHQLNEAIAALSGRVTQLASSNRLEEVEGAVTRIREDALQLRQSLQTLTEQTKPTLNSLHDQVTYLTRQFQKLPPPFDSTALRQEVTELGRLVADLVPKRELKNLDTEVKALQKQQESRAQLEDELRRKIQDLNQQLQSRPLKASVTALEKQITQLNRQFQKLPAPFDPTSLKQEVTKLMKVVNDLVPRGERDLNALAAQLKSLEQQQKFQRQLEETLRRELQTLGHQVQTLASVPIEDGDRPFIAPQPTEGLHPQLEFQSRIEEVLNRELVAIAQQLDELPDQPQLRAQIETTLRQELQEINEQLLTFPDGPHYELVFDFKSPGAPISSNLSANQLALYNALEHTQERLILILPWSSQSSLDADLMQRFEAFLARGCQLHIGWCHVANRDVTRFLNPINQRWSINPIQQGLQETLQKLLQLKRNYPQNFQFKILGTRENFLVSDHRFAIIGVDESLLTSTSFQDVELKLRTDDSDVILQCISRFDYPTLHPNDLTAHWNRAVTRYDLGDRAGAIEDFEQVLAIHPHDAATYNYRGLARHDQGDTAGAMADFTRALELNPDNAVVYCNRGFIRAEQGDYLGAISDYSLAIETQEDCAIAYFYRGIASQKINDTLAAVGDFSGAIRLVPDSAISYYYRAQSYEKLENWRAAIADFEHASHFFTARGSRKNAQKALKNLAKLKQSVSQQTLSQSNPIASAPVHTEEQSDYVESLTSILEEADAVANHNGHGNHHRENTNGNHHHEGTNSNAVTVEPIELIPLPPRFDPTDAEPTELLVPAEPAQPAPVQSTHNLTETLSSFFDEVDGTLLENVTPTNIFVATTLQPAETVTSNSRPEDETLADFCNRFSL